MDLVAMVLTGLSPLGGAVSDRDLVDLAVLLAVSTFQIEAGRRIERRRELAAEGVVYVDVQEVWVFAGLLVLPPPLLVALILFSYAHSWFRLRRIVIHRWAFSAATTLIATGAGAGGLAAWGGYPGWPTDGPLSLAAVLTAGVAYWFVQVGLVVGAILLSGSGASVRDALGGGPGAQLVTVTAIGLGVSTAVVLVHEPWLVLILVLTLLALHHGVVVHIDQLRAATRTDPKTGLAHSVYWFQMAEKELLRSRRLGTTLGVLLIDLDHFKRVNDRYGHLSGDEVIRSVARLLTREVRTDDLAGRFGGEEFAVLLPGVRDEAELAEIATLIRVRVENLRVPVQGQSGRLSRPGAVVDGVTASIGAAMHPHHGDTVEHLVVAADTACYRAKDAGRNTVRVAVPPPSRTPV